MPRWLAPLLVAACACGDSAATGDQHPGVRPDPRPAPSPESVPTARETDAARQLALGVPHLDGPELVSWHRVRLTMARSDEAVCSKLFRGNASDLDLVQALDSIPSADATEYLTIVGHAQALADRAPGLPPADPDSLLLGFQSIVASLGPAEASRFGRAVESDPSTVDDADACFAYRTLVGGALDLEEPIRTAFLRALVTDAAQSVLQR